MRWCNVWISLQQLAIRYQSYVLTRAGHATTNSLTGAEFGCNLSLEEAVEPQMILFLQFGSVFPTIRFSKQAECIFAFQSTNGTSQARNGKWLTCVTLTLSRIAADADATRHLTESVSAQEGSIETALECWQKLPREQHDWSMFDHDSSLA